MSNVVSPRGPLPPKVYWRRRLVMLGIVVAVALVVVQAFGGEQTEPVAERGAPRPSAKPSGDAGAGKDADRRADTRSREDSSRRARRDSGSEVTAPSSSVSGAAGPTAPSSGPCRTSDVLVVPDVEDTDALGVVPIRLGLSTAGTKACTFSFGSETVAVQVTSGDDQIWESLHCGRVFEEQSVVVRPGWLSYVTVAWPGRRGDDGCGDGNEFASPGYYWAEAAAIGGEPARSQFELETPPKPKPTEKPSDTPSEKPADGDSAQTEEPEAQATDEPRQPDGQQSQDEGSEESGDSGEQRDGEQAPVRPDRVGG
ncbi:MAG: hypothetical protein M3211_05605 [Actinomycetota bacterium]|nr:hypothetical protein [Actinomycetota bacterium]